ncbi:group XIIA secretory phospholipase A2-like [Trachinotus anak]|uniref:group XIIA secretory phospholipase A2-like n=1 Tax=Trachinotus anak TaxID=443729 RepID=UPI0039F219EB
MKWTAVCHIHTCVFLFVCSCGCFPQAAAPKQEPETPYWITTLKNICNGIHKSEPLLDAARVWFVGSKLSNEPKTKEWMMTLKSIYDKIQKSEPLLDAAWAWLDVDKYIDEKKRPEWRNTLKTIRNRMHKIDPYLNVMWKAFNGQWRPDWKMTLKTICAGVHMIEPLKDAAQVFVDGHDGLCHYNCSDGHKPVPRPGYKQSPPNGCGSSLFGFQFDGVPSMTKCCNQHDSCYDTCGREKRDCDEDLNHCLVTMCRNELGSLESAQIVQACESVVTLLLDTVRYLGCRPYQDSQRESCVCLHEMMREL